MKSLCLVLTTATAALAGFASPALASGDGRWGGYALGYYRDYQAVGTYDGYIPVTHVEYTTFTPTPVYMGYTSLTIVHPAKRVGPGGRHLRRY